MFTFTAFARGVDRFDTCLRHDLDAGFLAGQLF